MFSFNLVDEKWVPCLMPDGHKEDLSLKEVLSMARNISEIFDSSPLICAALHRLLLAIIHRSFQCGFGPANVGEWKAVWDSGHLNMADRYLRLWHKRFDLFDAAYPFYQWPSCAAGSKDKSEPVSIDNLLHDSAVYLSKATLFDHSTEASSRDLSPIEAARLLIAFQSFAVGGFAGLSKPRLKGEESAKAAPLVKGAVCLMRGENLFETLMLNLHIHNPEDGEPFPAEKDDKPAWERGEATIPMNRRPKGYLDLLTWQSRRIRLLPEQDEMGRTVIRNIIVRKGNQFPDGFSLHMKEPMQAFRKIEKPPKGQDPWTPVGFQEDRAVWRDSLALLQSVREKRARPQMVDWIADLVGNEVLPVPASYDMEVIGLISDQASVSLWRHERLPLPLKYLEDDRLVVKLRDALDFAENVGRLLGPGFVEVRGKGKTLQLPSPMRILAQEILPKDQNGKVDPDSAKSFVSSLSPTRPYWAALGIYFNHMVTALANDKPTDGEYGATILPQWAREVYKAAWQAFREATDSLDHSGRWLRAVTIAENSFAMRLNSIAKEFREPYDKSEKEVKYDNPDKEHGGTG